VRKRRLLGLLAVLGTSGMLACAEEAQFETGAGPGSDEPSSCDDVTAVPDDVADAFGLDPRFYAKHCAALGIDVLASERVLDAAMLEAGRIVEGMFAQRPALRDAVHDRYFRVVLVASSAGERLDEVPELSELTRSESAAAGLGPDPEFPAATVRDSVILCRPRDRDPQATPPGDTLVHELGHALLAMGLSETDPDFRARLEAAYRGARAEALWTLRLPSAVEALFGSLPTSNYLMTNPDEYWATGVSAWFGFKGIPLAYGLTDATPPGLQLQVIYGRDSLSEHDPGLSALLSEVFGPSPTLRPTCEEWIPGSGR
jgi:hypothetical protein